MSQKPKPEKPWPLQLSLKYSRDDPYTCKLCGSSLQRKWPFLNFRNDKCINPGCKSNNLGMTTEEMERKMRA